ncbi:MAG: hypothetical protein VX278_21895, partial [Myxococcota bacterium]|nr:hypothetical protein [Myxococcota bacterium]
MLLIELTWIIVDQIPPDAEDTHFDFTAHRVLSPLIKMLHSHPALRIGLALSPSLIDYLIEYDKDLLDSIRRLVDKDRIELLAVLMTPLETLSPEMVRYHLQLHKTYYMDVFDVDISGAVLWGFGWS